MNVIVRNMSPTAVKELDKMAKELNQSRQEFLKNELETRAFYQFNQDMKLEHEELLKQNMAVMQLCIDTVQRYQRLLEELVMHDVESE